MAVVERMVGSPRQMIDGMPIALATTSGFTVSTLAEEVVVQVKEVTFTA